MALSGQTAAIVDAMAQNMGLAAKDVARNMGNYSYLPPTVTLTDSTGKVGSLAFANLVGIIHVDWGDGTSATYDSKATSPKTHTYAANGAKTVKVSWSGGYKSSTATITT